MNVEKRGDAAHASSRVLVSRATRVLNRSTMIIACPACTTRYVVPDNAIGVEGRRVRCAKCRHSWFQEGLELETAAPPPATSSAPETGPAPESGPETVRPSAPAATAPPAPEPEAAPAPEPEAPPARMHEPEETADAAPAPAAVEDAEPPSGAAPESVPEVDVFSAAPALNSQVDTSSSYVVYDDTLDRADESEPVSTFEHAPPFRWRRNWGRIWMVAGIVFAVLALAASAAVAGFGLPDWLKTTTARTFAPAQSDLVMDFPPNRQDRRTLPNGTEFFGASGKITNIGKTKQYVPSILIVLRDARGRIVYSWEVVPPKRELAPGEVMNINEAVTDVPKSAVVAEIGWKPD